MKQCNTLVARSMGYIGKTSQEEQQYNQPLSIVGPASADMRSYHVGGKSAGELYRENWRRAKCVLGEFRL